MSSQAVCRKVGDQVRQERRLWPRVGRNGEEALIWLDVHRSYPVRVADESMTGIGILVPEALPIAVEQEVRIEYHGERLWAIVRHVSERPSAERIVGLEWGSRSVRSDASAPHDFQ